jgi:hypothetical protein
MASPLFVLISVLIPFLVVAGFLIYGGFAQRAPSFVIMGAVFGFIVPAGTIALYILL